MEISVQTKELVEKINFFSDKFIKNNFEVSYLIQSASNSGKPDLFNSLIFKAKYVRGLKSILSTGNITGDKYIEKIYSEFQLNLEEFIEQLRSIVVLLPDNISVHFSEKYLLLDHNSIGNIMDLIEDLSLCKEYYNAVP